MGILDWLFASKPTHADSGARIAPPCFRTWPVVVLGLGALLAGPVTTLQAQAPAVPPPTEVEVAAAIAAGESTRALELALRRSEETERQHVHALYTVARLHGLLGHPDEAFAWLGRAAAAGLLSVQEVRGDEAFAALREQERFRELTRAIWLKGYLWLLERPERDAYQMPEQVMRTLDFRPGERVADIGAGSGYFALRVARAVGPEGRVWALDINDTLLELLADRVAKAGLANVKVAKVERDDPKLPPGSVDTILMVDTLHYVADRPAYARKLAAALAPGGRVVVIDFLPKPIGERPWGPPPEQEMPRAEVDAAMAAAGLRPAAVHEFLTEQFFVEYRAAAEPAP
ncbi:MAG: methyltransferase domain-containing protein [Vicinamibacteria bacterium]|jgi:ubiquinone/menaquinone biosynthesis C-methylase UbiE|nr:methyltransferase domain-containing protein [Vicinamibacteria bacterium]